MSRSAVSLVWLAVALTPHAAPAQVNPDRPVKWESTCVEKGCLLQADVLRGDEYITIEIALEHKTQKPDYFAFHVDPNARQDQGLLISFTKKGAIDSDGSSKLAISDCDPKSCVARVPLGFVKKSKDSRNLNLLDKFLKSDDVVLVYTMDGKEYRTALPLSSFKQEYQRLLSTDLK